MCDPLGKADPGQECGLAGSHGNSQTAQNSNKVNVAGELFDSLVIASSVLLLEDRKKAEFQSKASPLINEL